MPVSAEGARLHIVGGFLGSGKTTAIAAAAKHLMQAGLRVGVVTNDQGRSLVDKLFFDSLAVPAVEVTGGCFCCNYDDLDARLSQLEAAHQPQVIFAESVGSCADMVATVLKPLLALRLKPASLSVFADSRLLLQRLRGLPLPFSETVTYVFDKQIEEASGLIATKTDLLAPPDRAELAERLAVAFPQMTLRLQQTNIEDRVLAWLQHLESAPAITPGPSLEIDYARYGEGEAHLAWLDARLTLELADAEARPVLIALINRLQHDLAAANAPIGHLKVLADDGLQACKISITTLEDAQWAQAVLPLSGRRLALVINIRSEIPSERLEQLLRGALPDLADTFALRVTDLETQHFHPRPPKPTHRMTDPSL